MAGIRTRRICHPQRRRNRSPSEPPGPIQSRLDNVEQRLTEIQDATDAEDIAEMVEEALADVNEAASMAEEADENLTPPEPEPIENDPTNPGVGQPTAPAAPADPGTPAPQ